MSDDTQDHRREREHPGGDEYRRPMGAGKECPRCGEPMDDVRKTCLNCGYEFAEDDYENPDAGTEFRAGVAVDEEGKEIGNWDPEKVEEDGSDA
ncbi:MAG: hypothetical protein M3124_08800 [Actinomycetota bacterium]|nr:hypothetical protein [Actinomycetota bacterium]